MFTTRSWLKPLVAVLAVISPLVLPAAPAAAASLLTVVGSPCAPSSNTAVALRPSSVIPDNSGGFFVSVKGPEDPSHPADDNPAYSAVCYVSSSGAVSTFAGDGALRYYQPPNGSAVDAELYWPRGMAYDAQSQTLYVADRHNQRVRQIHAGVISDIAGTPNGDVSTSTSLIDGQPATAAPLNFPSDVALAPSGDLYVADTNANVVVKFRPGGSISIVAGQMTSSGSLGDGLPAKFAQLTQPWGVAVDGAGSLYIADTGNNRIRKVDAATGIITTVAGGSSAGSSGDNGPATAALLNGPRGVSVSPTGDILIADSGNNRIRKITGGVISTLAAGLSAPQSVSVDSAGTTFVADAGNNRVVSISTSGAVTLRAGNGTISYAGDGGPAANAQLSQPTDVAYDSSGNLYIADSHNNVVRRVSATGTITTLAGNGAFGYADGAGSQAEFAFPTYLAVDESSGSVVVYVADSTNSRIRRIDSQGNVTTIAGTGTAGYNGDLLPATQTQLSFPLGLALNSGGVLYVSDSGNNRIRSINLATGSVSTIAGVGVASFGGDGGPATAAFLNSPFGIALAPNGALYIADTKNSRVRKVSTDGTISTVAGTGSVGYRGSDTTPAGAALNNPDGVRMVANDVFLLADTGNCIVRRVDLQANTIVNVAGSAPPDSVQGTANTPRCHSSDTSWGGGPSTDVGMLDLPTSTVVKSGDSSGAFLVVDSLGNRVRQFQP